ncbi:hypothetical protein EJ08DRAFT_663323 [Tothia fuscella]|uniref:Uncharacterized protein n=1 Tax=Tothia fuscella TaxID=1048955 RepID=A0A9P4TWA4_9PEZI|nr:hypothetical protein EJ08DRAFT_663323 [Tothia fuscella]
MSLYKDYHDHFELNPISQELVDTLYSKQPSSEEAEYFFKDIKLGQNLTLKQKTVFLRYATIAFARIRHEKVTSAEAFAELKRVCWLDILLQAFYIKGITNDIGKKLWWYKIGEDIYKMRREKTLIAINTHLYNGKRLTHNLEEHKRQPKNGAKIRNDEGNKMILTDVALNNVQKLKENLELGKGRFMERKRRIKPV